MKISELIKKLRMCKKTSGDVDVFLDEDLREPVTGACLYHSIYDKESFGENIPEERIKYSFVFVFSDKSFKRQRRKDKKV